MTLTRRSWRRRAAWLVPAVTALTVGGAVGVPLAASAGSPSLAPVSAAALLTAVRTSPVRALSGRVVQTSNLGLPALPSLAGGTSFDVQTLLSGTSTFTVAVDGAERQRIALVGPLAESDVVRNGPDLWSYASNTQAVTHLTVPSDGSGATTADTAPGTDVTPAATAAKLLDLLTPTTQVSVPRTTVVAGRDAYVLTLAPRDSSSTVREVDVAVDAANGVPLRVQVYGSGAAPAFETGFTSVDFATPSASTFRFSPPAGSKVTEGTPWTAGGRSSTTGAAGAVTASGLAGSITGAATVGSGWTTVLVARGSEQDVAGLLGAAGSGAAPSGRGTGRALAAVDKLFTVQPDGDRLLQTALVNVLLTTDGRLLAGAVQPSVLQAAAQSSAQAAAQASMKASSAAAVPPSVP